MILKLVAAIALLVLVSCDGDAELRQAARRAMERTTPGAESQYAPSVNRAGLAAEATWELQTDMSWKEYGDWLTDRLSPQYERRPTADGSLVFHRALAGDTHTIRLNIVSAGPPLRIRGTFTRGRREEGLGMHLNQRANRRMKAIIVLAALTPACGTDSTPPDAARLRSLTVPPGGKAFPPLTKISGDTAETSWIVQTDWSWPQYVKWIQEKLAPEFNTITVTAKEIVCRDPRQERRDTLRIRRSGDTSATSVRVTVETPNK